MLRVDHDEAGIRGTPPSLYPSLREAALGHELRTRAALHDYHLYGDEVNADSRAGHEQNVRIAVEYRPILRLNTV